MMVRCPSCNSAHWIDGGRAEDLLRELVELKRVKDAGFVGDAERQRYENSRHIAWSQAFRFLGVAGEPKR